MRIFKATVNLDIVVQAYDPEEAMLAVKRNTTVERIPRTVSALVEVTTKAQLPAGWTGGELAFSAHDHDPVYEQSIAYWLAQEPRQLRIFRAPVMLAVVAQAKDPEEAMRAIERHAFIDGVTCTVNSFQEIFSIDQLPQGWEPDQIALSAWAPSAATSRPIGHWLERALQQNTQHAVTP